jgi:hypothetical protein
MVSTCGLIHQRAASSILALSTRDACCAAEKTVICWCGVKPRVTGAALAAALGSYFSFQDGSMRLPIRDAFSIKSKVSH